MKLQSFMQSCVLAAELELNQLYLRKLFLHFSEVMKTLVSGDDDPHLSAASVVHVSRQRKFLTLLGLKEGVGQSDGVH